MRRATQLLLSFYGDDFTGSTAALECLSTAGARTVLFLKPPSPEDLARYDGLQAVGVAGMTRSMEPNAIESTLRPALAGLRRLGAAHVHYKVCSTFDSSAAVGSIGKAIDVATEMFAARFVPVLGGSPMLGRYCVFGNLFAKLGQQGEAFRLDRHPSMSSHPTTPAGESDLRRHLAQQTAKRIGLFDVLKADLPAVDASRALEELLNEGAEVVLFDALHQGQLGRLGRLFDRYASRARPLFSVGSSAVEEALGAHWAAEGRLTPRRRWPKAGRAEPLLVVSGSCSPVTEKQIAWAKSQGFAEIGLDTTSLAEGKVVEKTIQQTVKRVLKQLGARHGTIVHTSLGNRDRRREATLEILARRGLAGLEAKAMGAQLFGEVLGRVVREAVEQTGVRRIVSAGGDTSGHVAKALGIQALEMLAPLTAGAPLCRALAPGSPADGLEFAFKGGQVGGPDYFETVMRGIP